MSDPSGWSCPLPLRDYPRVVIGHGGGGKLTAELIEHLFVPAFNGAEPTEYWLGTNNFFAITQYNRSYFYAMSVIELGRTVRQKRALQARL